MLRLRTHALLCLTLLAVVLTGCKSVPLWGGAEGGATARPAPVATAVPAPPPAQAAPPVAPAEPPAQVEAFPLGAGPATPAGAEAGPAAAQSANIALLLPLRSPDFVRAAEAVRAGFEAAAGFQSNNALPVLVYPLDNEGDALMAAYAEALAKGARCVVAGLTRDGAAALAAQSNVSVPTLVLNTVERAGPLPAQLYSLSLSLDGEARQVARLAASKGYHSMDLLVAGTPLARRIGNAFEQEWQSQAGELIAKLDIGKDPNQTSTIKASLQAQPADALFIAADGATVKSVRPSLSMTLPMFATSQVNDGKAGPGNVDLQGIIFVDMPWMVQPDHPAVAVYPRPAQSLGADLERLYALGIDAYRLAMGLAKTGGTLETLDGVTGKITLTDQHIFQRELTPARFEEGQVVLLKSDAQ